MSVSVPALMNRQRRLPREISAADARGKHEQAQQLRERYQREQAQLKRMGRG